jgi:vitamin B12 transporter
VLDPIIVTVSRFPENAGNVGSASTIIDRAEIESAQAENVAELLESVPGLSVFQSGGVGSSTSVSIRGAESDQTLVMIDGIRVNDPASTGSEFDFSVFTLANVERIEIIRGPQSGVYGSDAIGGVINIITRKARPGERETVAEAEGGSYKTHAQRLYSSATQDDISVSVAASNFRTSGFSRFSGGTEDDATRKQSVHARLDYDPTSNFGLTITGGRYKLDAELDSVGLSSGKDTTDNVDRLLTLASATARLDLLNGDFSNKLTAFITRSDRDFFDDDGFDDPLSVGFDNLPGTSVFEGQSRGFEYQGDLVVRNTDRFVFGGKIDEQSGTAFDEFTLAGVVPRYDVSETWRSAFALYSFNPTDDLSFTGAIRLDEFGDVATETTYRLTAAYRIPSSGTKLRASYGTGAKAPTIQQRFEDSGFATGNPDLEVETSKGFDIGVDQDLLDGAAMLSGAYFSNDIDNLINCEGGLPCTFVNVARAEIDGVELSASWFAADWLTLRGAYTWLDAIDATTGLALARRPEHTFNLSATLQPAEGFSITASAIYVGERFNRSNERNLLDDYIRVDLNGSYDLTESAQLYFRAENVLNADYEEIKDFGTAGRSGYVGLRARF